MSSRKKQSKNKKNGKSRSHRIKKKTLGKNQRPKESTPLKPKNIINDFFYKTISNEQLADDYIDSLHKDILLYKKYKKYKNKIINPPKNLLTQIERKLNNLNDLDGKIKLTEGRLYLKDFILEKLSGINFTQELIEYKKQMKKQGLERDPKTNHYPGSRTSKTYLF